MKEGGEPSYEFEWADDGVDGAIEEGILAFSTTASEMT